MPCPGCGYNLRGVREPVCPECGRECSLTEFGPFRDRRRFSFAWVVLPLIVHGGFLLVASSYVGLMAEAHDVPSVQNSIRVFIIQMICIGIVSALLTIIAWRHQWHRSYCLLAGILTLALGVLLPLLAFALFML